MKVLERKMIDSRRFYHWLLFRGYEFTGTRDPRYCKHGLLKYGCAWCKGEK